LKLVGRISSERLDAEKIVRLDYPPFGVVVVRTERRDYALEESCNHAGASLATGWVEDDCLICPVHRYAFDLATGSLVRPKGLCPPQRTFVVRREGDDVAVYDAFQLSIVR
jgi:nitrite reductase/ring-hydroxylating ferredoxin subunit